MNITTTKSIDALKNHLRKWFPENAIHLNDIMPEDAENVINALGQIEGFVYDDGYMPLITLNSSALIKALKYMLENETISQNKYDNYVKQIEPIDWEIFVYSIH